MEGSPNVQDDSAPSESEYAIPKQPTPPRRPHAPQVVVEVTTEIIAQSEQRDSSHCMIAEAIKLAVPNARHISVDLQTIRFSDPEKMLRYTYLTPRRAQVAIIRFDQGMHSEPMSITLRDGHVTKSAGFAPETRRARGSTMPEGQQSELRGNGGHRIGVRVGGRTPPVGPLTNTHYTGKRRQFGLRGLEL